MVLDHERDYPSRWTAIVLISEKIGCVPQTLFEWVKKVEVNSGKRVGMPTEMNRISLALALVPDEVRG